jgi:hypothetical protein
MENQDQNIDSVALEAVEGNPALEAVIDENGQTVVLSVKDKQLQMFSKNVTLGEVIIMLTVSLETAKSQMADEDDVEDAEEV